MKLLVHEDGEAVVDWENGIMKIYVAQEENEAIPEELKDVFNERIRWSYGDVEVKEVTEKLHLA